MLTKGIIPNIYIKGMKEVGKYVIDSRKFISETKCILVVRS